MSSVYHGHLPLSYFLILFVFTSVSTLRAQLLTGGPSPTIEVDLSSDDNETFRSKVNNHDIDLDDLLQIFEESEPFEPGSNFLWVTYGLINNIGDRPDRVGVIIPPLSLNYEISLFANFGVRASGALYVWEEDKTLARAGDLEFKELFEYRYWTAGLGVTYHLNVGERWDPYVGYSFTYRRGRAFCDCVDESLTKNSQNFFAGVRWMAGDRFYLQAELGSTNVSILEAGLGFRFSK